MKCADCKRPIAAGIEATKMCCTYTQPDATLRTYGLGLPDGPLSAATGQLVAAHHSKCYWALVKRRAALTRILDDRAADPHEASLRETDWRSQVVVDVADVPALEEEL